MHGLREQYQDDINFVILDWDIDEENDFAAELGLRGHPVIGFYAPDGETVKRVFGPQQEDVLVDLIDEVVANYGS